MARVRQPANVIGSRVSAARQALGLTQDQLAAKCQRNGWDISRSVMSQIEAGMRGVRDFELRWLSEMLGISLDELFPKNAGEWKIDALVRPAARGKPRTARRKRRTR